MKMKVLGPEGTNSHEAANIAVKRPGMPYFGAEPEFCRRNVDVLEAVASGGVYGIVPIENSGQSMVSEVIKGFWLKEGERKPWRPVRVIGELHLPISHHLLVRPSVQRVHDIGEVISHPQALGQCSGNLEKLGQHGISYSNSTAAAAQKISQNPDMQSSAALATLFAANVYGLKAIRLNMEDEPGNTTRFHILGRSEIKPTGKDRTALIYRIPNKPRAKNNVEWCIGIEDVNISSSHSISLGLPGEYAFYCEFDEHVDTPIGERIMQRMRTVTDSIFVLGSYPQSALEKGNSL
jgi:chorismate mutase / prephenate dehydratase